MANNAVLSNGATIKVKVTSAYVPINGITDFSGLLGGTAAVIDVSDLNSTSKDKLMGMPDEGSVSISGNYIAADVGQGALITGRAASAKLSFQATVGGKTFTFDGFCTKAEVGASIDKQVPFSAEVEITGPVTLSAPAV